MKTITRILLLLSYFVASLSQSATAQDTQKGNVPEGQLSNYEYTYLSKGKYLIRSVSMSKGKQGKVWATYYDRTAEPRIDSTTVQLMEADRQLVDSLLSRQAARQDLRGSKTRFTHVGYGQVETFHAEYTSGDTLGMVGYLDSYGLSPINKAILEAILHAKYNGKLTTVKKPFPRNATWHDGKQIYVSSYDGQKLYIYDNDQELLTINKSHNGIWTVSRRNPKIKNRLTVKAGMHMTYEQTADYPMLIFRDASGKAVDILLAENSYHDLIVQAQHDLLDGIYEHPIGKSIFGNNTLRDDEQFQGDPGNYKILTDRQTGLPTDTIIFGEGRIKRPPVPDYIIGPDGQKEPPPPGYNGYASIAGPILWTVTIGNDGNLDCREIHAVEYVEKYPDFGKEFHLRRLRSGYKYKDGLWGIASWRPLSRGMLEHYSKATLRIMRNEIYARHGDTFSDTALQEYFEQQEWYQPVKGKSIKLTDLEQLNIAIIRNVENSR